MARIREIDLARGPLALVFVSENCVGCQQLLAELERQPARSDVLLVAKDPTASYQDALADMKLPFIADSSGRMWQECQVTATPLVVRLDAQGRVISKEVTHHVAPTGAEA